jgi:hypothetical protein
MPYSLIFTESYERIEKRFLKRHPDLLDRYHEPLAILEQDPVPPFPASARSRGSFGRSTRRLSQSAISHHASNWNCASRRSSWSASAVMARCISLKSSS